MKFIHVGDLHIGKRVNEFSMLEDQKFVIDQILKLIIEEQVNGVLIAGDVYDKTIPSIEAIEVFEDFIESLNRLNVPAYIVSGNHDSVERLSAFANLIKSNGIYISKPYNGKIIPISVENTDIWLLPFLRPADVRKYHQDVEIGSYNDAIKKVIENLQLDKSKTNILVAHQFITSGTHRPEISDSEVCSLGTLDNVDYNIFDDFDYVALGHIHKPQSMGRTEVRYCGSPLKYSFSEVNQKKSITLINIDEAKKCTIETFDFKPLRDMKEIKGSLEELLLHEPDDSYIHITLTDKSVVDAKNKLESVFPNIMKLDFEEYNQIASACGNIESLKEKSLNEHFSEFFVKQNGRELTLAEQSIVESFLDNQESVAI